MTTFTEMELVVVAQTQSGQDSDSTDRHMNAERPSPPLALEEDGTAPPPPPPPPTTTTTLRRVDIRRNFMVMSILVALLPATALACLALATAELGTAVGAAQSAVLYVTYTASSVTGSAVVVQRRGPKQALHWGMTLLCTYVACFVAALSSSSSSSGIVYVWTMTGAAVGGLGAGLLWTAQGVYLVYAAIEYHHHHLHPRGDTVDPLSSSSSLEQATSYLSSLFAFVFLALETILDTLSTVLTQHAGWSWRLVFAVYATIAILATCALPYSIKDYAAQHHSHCNGNYITAEDASSSPVQSVHGSSTNSFSSSSTCHKVMAAWFLMRNDARARYLAGINVAFGMTGAFLNAFCNAQVVPVVFGTDDYVGLLVAIHGGTAAFSSLLLGYCATTSTTTSATALQQRKVSKATLCMTGAIAFLAVGLPFCIQPSPARWTRAAVVAVYMVQGYGRATFEATLRGLFADWFVYEKEGAFATLILQNGFGTAAGYLVVSVNFPCLLGTKSLYCLEYSDGSHHSILALALLVVTTSLWAVCGLYKANQINNLHVIQMAEVDSNSDNTLSNESYQRPRRGRYNKVATGATPTSEIDDYSQTRDIASTLPAVT